MARNSLADLNNHLFEQLERMNDTSLSEEKAMDIFHEKTWDLVGTEVSEIQLYTND